MHNLYIVQRGLKKMPCVKLLPPTVPKDLQQKTVPNAVMTLTIKPIQLFDYKL